MLLKRFFWLTVALSNGVGCVNEAPGVQDTTDALLRDVVIVEMDMDAPPDAMDSPDLFSDSDALDGGGIMPSEDADLATDIDAFDGSLTVDFTVPDVDANELDPDLSDMALPVADQGVDVAISDISPSDMDPPQSTGVSNSAPPLQTVVRGNPNGGARFDDVCPDGQVLIGVAGEIRNGNQYLGRLRGICGEVRIELGNPMSIGTLAGADLPLRGAFGGGVNFGVTCQAGSAVVGFSGRAGNLVDQLILHCGSLSLDGINVVAIGNMPLPPVGGNGGDPIALITCPDGQTAAGALIRAGDGIDGFGLLCSPLTVRP
ncbi:MAG: hypothetical protein CMH52_14155 [Myxococcales bacterium]|nr:hypothetical protein [Myxococcales bacterium]